MNEELRFGRGSANPARLRAALEAVLAEPDLRGRDDLPDRVEVREDGQGIDPIAVTVVITLVRLTGRMATSVWDDVLWPRLRRRLDDDALGERRDDR